MSILSSPLKGVLRSPLSSPLFSGSMWWLAFGQNANFAYDLVNNRYMRSGGASTQALSLTEDRASSALVLQSNGTYVERAAGELAIGQGVGGQFSQAVTNHINSDMSGAALGVVGSGGALPDGWSSSTDTTAVTGLGVSERGVPYVRIRLQQNNGGGSPQYPALNLGIDRDTIPGADWYSRMLFTRLSDTWNPRAVVRIIETVDGFGYLGFGGLDISGAEKDSLIDVKIPHTVTHVDAGSVRPDIVLTTLAGESFDIEFQIEIPSFTATAFTPPAIIGPADTTRSADNPVVVQGLGDELVANGDFADDLDGWEYDGSAIEQPYAMGGILYIPREVGATFIVRQQIADDLIIGNSYFYTFEIVDGGLRPRLGHYEDNGSYYSPATTQYPGVYGVPFVATSTNLWAYFLPLIDNSIVSIRGVSAKQVFPYPGYNTDGTLSGRELVEGGGFDTQADVDDHWDVTEGAGGPAAVSGGVVSLPRTAGADPTYIDQEMVDKFTVGRVQEYTAECLQSSARFRVGTTRWGFEYVDLSYVPVGVYSAHFLAGHSTLWARALPMADGQTAKVDNISLQEVEPGVIIECTGVWGDTDEQIAFRLSDGTASNEIKVMRLNSGNLRLAIIKDGGLVYGADSSGAWPDNTEAALRLEITDTVDGTFYALFLDDVFTGLGAGPVDYPQAVNELDLSPVAGVKTITEIYGK